MAIRIKDSTGKVVFVAGAGKPGATFQPAVSEDGTLNWTNDGGLENPAPVNIRGPKGADGAPGSTGAAGADGAPGPAGTPGRDATINGVNATTITATGGITGSQSGGTYTIDGSGLRPKATPITLTAAGWDSGAKTQTVTVAGVLADESKQLIMAMPAATSQAAYIKAGILCTGQGANTLTFTAETEPTENLTVYVTVQEVAV